MFLKLQKIQLHQIHQLKKKGTNSSSDGFGDNKADSIWATIPPLLLPFPLGVRWVPHSLSLPVKNSASSPNVPVPTRVVVDSQAGKSYFQIFKKWKYTMGWVVQAEIAQLWVINFVSTSFMLRFVWFVLLNLWFLYYSFVFVLLFGNSAKDFLGIVPLSAPGEDQRKSAQCVSPLLLFTSIFFQQKETQSCGEIWFFVSLALLYTWLSFRVQETTVTGRKRKLLGRASRRRQTGELQLEGGCYRGGSSSMGSSSGLRDCAARQGGRGSGERKEGWEWQFDNLWWQVSLLMFPSPSHPASWDHLELKLAMKKGFWTISLGQH